MTSTQPHSATPAGVPLADGLVLPLDTATETFAILAKRGRGKTFTAAVIVEGLVSAGIPAAVIDPTGVWWGLRSSADGADPGLPVVIFGGEHADVPLEEGAGDLVARVIVEQRIPAVLDLSLFRKNAARVFVTDFLETLYRTNREPLHAVVDEADLFAPQRTYPGAERLLGAMEDVFRRGRVRGLGATAISQRAQAVSKSVLEQVETLILLGMTGTNDINAARDWVRAHADEDQARDVIASLPSLPVGEAWIWSPMWLQLLRRIKVQPRATFDSSSTPKTGQRRTEPQQWATIDPAALGERITALAAQAAEDKPDRLKARIAQLEHDLATARRAQPPPQVQHVEVPIRVEVPVPMLSNGEVEALTAAAQHMRGVAGELVDAATAVTRQLEQARPPQPSTPPTPRLEPSAGNGNAPARRTPAPSPSPSHGEVDPGDGLAPPSSTSPGSLSKAEREILAALATHGRLHRTSRAAHRPVREGRRFPQRAVLAAYPRPYHRLRRTGDHRRRPIRARHLDSAAHRARTAPVVAHQARPSRPAVPRRAHRGLASCADRLRSG